MFGEIEDEHDNINLLEEKISNKKYNFSARLDVEYLNETYKFNLPENENYETLGGLIVNSTEEIPQENEVIKIEKFLFTIKEVSNTKINVVTLQIQEEE